MLGLGEMPLSSWSSSEDEDKYLRSEDPISEPELAGDEQYISLSVPLVDGFMYSSSSSTSSPSPSSRSRSRS